MNNNKIAKYLAVVVAASSLLVMLGWVFDIAVLKSLAPQWMAMSFIGAVNFLLSAIILYFTARYQQTGRQNVELILVSTSFIIFLITALLFVADFLGISSGLENILSRTATVAVSHPSLAGVVCSVLVAICGLLSLSRHNYYRQIIRILGLVMAVAGVMAVLGYLSNQPMLYYEFKPVAAAMAFNTALMFTCLGVGFIYIEDVVT